MTYTEKRLELVDTICKCRRGSMDDKQYRGTVENVIHQALAEDRERMRGYITDEEKLLKISKNGAEEVIMNLRTRISSLDKLTDK